MPLVEVFGELDGKYEPVAEARPGQVLSLAEPFRVEFDPGESVGPRRSR